MISSALKIKQNVLSKPRSSYHQISSSKNFISSFLSFVPLDLDLSCKHQEARGTLLYSFNVASSWNPYQTTLSSFKFQWTPRRSIQKRNLRRFKELAWTTFVSSTVPVMNKMTYLPPEVKASFPTSVCGHISALVQEKYMRRKLCCTYRNASYFSLHRAV